jgi:hypothetical protein
MQMNINRLSKGGELPIKLADFSSQVEKLWQQALYFAAGVGDGILQSDLLDRL